MSIDIRVGHPGHLQQDDPDLSWFHRRTAFDGTFCHADDRRESGAHAIFLYWRRDQQFSNCLQSPPVQGKKACTVKRAVQWVGALRFYHGGGASRKGAA